MFILTGSQAFHLMNNVTQSLAGRVSVIQMQPLSLDEILEIESEPFIPTIERIQKYKDRPAIEVKKLFEYIVKGGYPELYKEENKNIDDYYENYINTYIDRDVSELINVKDKMKFHDFLQYLAAITSQQVNASDIGRKIGVSYQTINHWLSILEATGIIYFIQPYNDFSIVKRIVKSPKVYFADTGVAAYLARLNNPETLMVSHFSGGFNETFIMNEIRKSFLNNKLPFHAYCYRDTNQHEIDLVLLYEGQLSLVEIKQGVSFQLSDVKSFQQLKYSMYPIQNQLVVCNTLDNYPLSKDVMVVSLKCI